MTKQQLREFLKSKGATNVRLRNRDGKHYVWFAWRGWRKDAGRSVVDDLEEQVDEIEGAEVYSTSALNSSNGGYRTIRLVGVITDAET